MPIICVCVALAIYCIQLTTSLNIYPITGPNDCDFDSGLCHFQQDQTDDFDFRQRIGPTPSGATGPDADHTTQRTGIDIYNISQIAILSLA